MDVKSILLGSLFNRSMTGYELKKYFSISFAYFSGLSYGSIYPALKKLEENGLITMQLEIQESAPNRKVYTITAAGREAFLKELKSPFSIEKHKFSLLIRMFFFAQLSKEERLGAVQNYLDSIRSELNLLEAAQPEIENNADQFQYLCFQFGQRFLKDFARNVESVMGALEDDIRENQRKPSEQ